MPCRAAPCPASPRLAGPRPAMPSLAKPRLAAPSLAAPCHARPRLASPRISSVGNDLPRFQTGTEQLDRDALGELQGAHPAIGAIALGRDADGDRTAGQPGK